MPQRILALAILAGLTLLVACSGASQPPPPTAVAAPASTAVAVAGAATNPSPATATALPPPLTPSPTAAAPATATPAVVTTTMVWVANTEGGGVFLRNSPHDGDRAGVLPEGTQLTVTGEELEGDGQRWYPVKTADSTEGYVPIPYTAKAVPATPPGSPTGQPK
jgi:hypothetical protein